MPGAEVDGTGEAVLDEDDGCRSISAAAAATAATAELQPLSDSSPDVPASASRTLESSNEESSVLITMVVVPEEDEVEEEAALLVDTVPDVPDVTITFPEEFNGTCCCIV